MEQEKYYTPNISEFHVGFEAYIKPELIRIPDLIHSNRAENVEEKFEFIKTTVNAPDILHYSLNPDLIKTNVRIKHLDQEDIESLGWTCDSNSSDFSTYSLNSEKTYNTFISACFGYKRHSSRYITIQNDNGILFKGIINNKSELKKVMEMLGIK